MNQIEENRTQAERSRVGIQTTFYYGWVIVVVCFLVLILSSLVASSFPIFYVPILQDFSRGRGATALAMSIHLVLSGLSAPFAGWLIDRFGPRVVMPVGALATGIALLWLSQSSALWQFYLSFGVMAAIGSATIHITPLTAVASNWFTRRRATAISIVVAGPGAGQLLLLPLLQNLIDSAGWRNTYFIFGAVILIVPTVLILLFLYSRPSDRGISSELEEQQTNANGKGNKSEVVTLDKAWAETDWTVAKAIRTVRFWALTLVMPMVSMSLFVVSVHLAAYLSDKGYSSILAAWVMGLQGLINIIGSLLGGILADRLGREKTVTLGMFIFIACIVLLSISGSVVSTLFVYGFAILFGIGYGMAFPALMAAAADLFQGRHFGSILGVMMLSGYFGGAVGAWLGGFLFDLTHVYRWNFFVAAALMLTSAALIWKASPSKVRVMRSVRGG